MQTISTILGSIIMLFNTINKFISAVDDVAEMCVITTSQAKEEMKLQNAKQLEQLEQELNKP